MFNWFWKLWLWSSSDTVEGGGIKNHNNHYNNKFTHIIKWKTFQCCTYKFDYKHVFNNKNVIFYNILDYLMGLKITREHISNVNWNDNEILHLNDVIFTSTNHNNNNNNRNKQDNLSSLYGSKQKLVGILQNLNFEHKNKVLLHIMGKKFGDDDNKQDDIHDKIETVLQHVKKLNNNSEKFMLGHEMFKNEVHDKFKQFETRFQDLDAKLNVIQSAEELKHSLQQHYCNNNCINNSDNDNDGKRRVMFPRDITKHQHLAVFSERINDHTKLAFVSGQEYHFRKRKLQYEEDGNMETLYDDVHPNPLLAIQCINENFYEKNYKINKLAKRLINVNCDSAVAKSIVNECLKN
ncbi:hypothetical protein [Lonomia obliqua multiple nucleopolyhedrovirus]|uniref:DUF3627 domain-containing protein n=1 Tax=Lonomia obliqua multiple nucleopolyhedrovirus TaxID=134394 RepID=A0A126FCA3_9ABAC|nr:hypothetical protein [Lonomia obliqua multiple nucleopolyhedrovirus]AKN81013.1 hypothetical protein [Lonomia obliqua multiple nucleopolyhedrovirus]